MTLLNIVRGFEQIALTHPNIRTAKDGSIYDIMNANPAVKYGAFVVTQNTHRQTEKLDYYGFTIFYCDRLVDNMDSNRLQIQSFGKQVLGNIIHSFCSAFDVEVPIINYTTWTQKFMDECAGVYAQFELEIPVDLICPEEYE